MSNAYSALLGIMRAEGAAMNPPGLMAAQITQDGALMAGGALIREGVTLPAGSDIGADVAPLSAGAGTAAITAKLNEVIARLSQLCGALRIGENDLVAMQRTGEDCIVLCKLKEDE